ncbi:MAG: hypothetical protein JWO64_2385 [Hyphomicrobiales bacterium]|jgi:hypothetical protein|nr:hypothetical protein [Hyphomicrobiales bacterium]
MQTSIERERAISQHVAAHGPADYVRWMKDFAAFRDRVIIELEKLRIPDEWLVRSSLAASRAWESLNPCPITNEEIDRLRAQAAEALGV